MSRSGPYNSHVNSNSFQSDANPQNLEKQSTIQHCTWHKGPCLYKALKGKNYALSLFARNEKQPHLLI